MEAQGKSPAEEGGRLAGRPRCGLGQNRGVDLIFHQTSMAGQQGIRALGFSLSLTAVWGLCEKCSDLVTTRAARTRPGPHKTHPQRRQVLIADTEEGIPHRGLRTDGCWAQGSAGRALPREWEQLRVSQWGR